MEVPSYFRSRGVALTADRIIGRRNYLAASARASTLVVMENGAAAAEQEERKVYAHYNHTDPCKHLRWTARESYQYMYQRPWERVADFYLDLVHGRSSLSGLFDTDEEQTGRDEGETCASSEGTDLATRARPEDRTGRWARATYKIVLSYHGTSFDGWQKQPGLNTIQGIVEKSLGSFVDERKAQQLKDRSLPVEPCVLVAGRTDKGVTALWQVCSFYTWRNDVNTIEIETAINNAAPGKLRALYVSKVSRAFHPNFSAKWRRYVYIFPFNNEELVRFGERASFAGADTLDDQMKSGYPKFVEENDGFLSEMDDSNDASDPWMKPRTFSISKVNRLIQQLEGKTLSYKMYARDTKASRNEGPATECYMFHARAAEARLPCIDKAHMDGQRVMCVELVANRFLRRMVRVLVTTTIREAAAGASDEALLNLMDATCRRATAPPAPPDGLCLADVGYEDFRRENCLILK